jgi:RNA polymerase sigma-70 factor (ECF subfamily)
MSFSDAELIVRVVANDDRNAFAELVRRNQSDVRRLLRRMTGDDGLADDLAQETFVRAWRSLPQFRGGARLSSWLYRIAYNTFLAHARKTVPAPEAPDVEVTMDPVLMRHDLTKALAILRPEERAALALTVNEQVTHEEAAQILDVPLGTLKTHVLRAKEKLRARLEMRP